jgi:ribose transport system substrate-binding protein
MESPSTLLAVSPQETPTSPETKYLVGPILRACEILKAFRSHREVLPLHELVARTGLNKTTAFRAARSLVAGGLLEQVAGDQYRPLVVSRPRREFRLGYAAMSSTSLFSREITEGIRLAAASRGVELIELDNHLSARVAIRNSERLVRDRVDLAIEFQVAQKAADTISHNFAAAGIPLIAIHTPHPGAVFFGGNNYVAGRIAGRALGRWAARKWGGKVDSVLLLGHAAAGSITHMRLTGTTVGITETLYGHDSAAVVEMDVKGGYAETLEALMKYIPRTTATRILVGCINDSVALAAARAFEETGRAEHCAVVGQNGTLPARVELRRPHSRLIGSVGFFPERYGEQILSLAFDILEGKATGPAVFIKHTLITRENVNDLYPNDALAVAPDPNSLLFNRYH